MEQSEAAEAGAQIVLCAFDKEKLLTAFLLAKAPGGDDEHHKGAEIYSYVKCWLCRLKIVKQGNWWAYDLGEKNLIWSILTFLVIIIIIIQIYEAVILYLLFIWI